MLNGRIRVKITGVSILSDFGPTDTTPGPDPADIARTCRSCTTLPFATTLTASRIWGVSTRFFLDASLSNAEACDANTFFALGMVVCEVPTGLIAQVSNFGVLLLGRVRARP